MHLVNILDCEESTLFKQATKFHSEVLIINNSNDAPGCGSRPKEERFSTFHPGVSKSFLPDSVYFSLHYRLSDSTTS